MKIRINRQDYDIPQKWVHESLLSVLRDYLAFTGTKFGCGKGLCGACTVHMDGQIVRSCVLPVDAVKDRPITTIEGLADGQNLHPVQVAWKALSVPQCGYCQVGQIMTAAAFLEKNNDPSRAEVIQAMNGNLCRCGTYDRIQNGVLYAAKIRREKV